MYSESFKFGFIAGVVDSESMAALEEMFLAAEKSGIAKESFGSFVIDRLGAVKFISYTPDLTEVVVSWLKINIKAGKLNVQKPRHLSNA